MSLNQKGIVHIIPLLVIVIVIGAAVAAGVFYFSFPKQPPKQPTVTLSSVKECEGKLSPILEKGGEGLSETLDECKKKITRECDEKLAEVDNALSIEADWQERIKLFEERKAVAGACLNAWIDGPLSLLSRDSDAPLLGRGEFGETDALDVLCKDILGEFDDAISKETVFDKKWGIYQKRKSVVSWCFDEWLSGRHAQGDKRMPLLGRGELGQTAALKKVCDESINDIDAKLKTEKDFEKRRDLYKERERIVSSCLNEWHTGKFSAGDVPLLGGNGYNETNALISDCKERIKASPEPGDIIKECKKKFESGVYDRSKEPNWNTLQSKGSPPSIGTVTYDQLHTSYEERPHRYLLKAKASDPEGGGLTFVWKIDCGYFVGVTTGQQVEWHYDTPGECVDASVTVKASDSEGNIAEKTQKVF